MAINLTPLKKIINNVSHYKVYNGNSNLTPINYQHGAVVLCCTSSAPVSSPVCDRSFYPGDKWVTEIIYTYNEYHYQIDIIKTVSPQPSQSPLVAFEQEAFIIIDALNTSAPKLHRESGLGLSKIRTRLWMDKTHSKPVHRLVGEFTIVAKSEVRFRNTADLVNCADVKLHRIDD